MKEESNVYRNPYDMTEILAIIKDAGFTVEKETPILSKYLAEAGLDRYEKIPDRQSANSHPATHTPQIDSAGNLVVKNLEAYWLLDIRIVEEVDSTIYTVTGSYDGTEMLHRRISRIMQRKAEESE